METPPQQLLAPLIDRFTDLVDRKLAEVIAREEQVSNLHDGLLYSLGLDIEDRLARGKRLRPMLCLATAEALGSPPESALGFACGIELMHNFALVHDDIEDGDDVRRDRPCTYKKYGLAHGINIGDYLFCKVISVLLEETGPDAELTLKLIRLMSETLDHTHIGQSLDISARSSRRFTHDDYFRLVKEKTSYYLAAPMLGGAIVANAPPEVLSSLSKFGHYIGPLFQITDDTLDLTEGKGRGGMIGSDIREGKRSFLVAEVTACATEEEIGKLYDILDRPREETTESDVEWVIALYRQYQVIEKAENYGRELLEKGLAALRRVPAPLEAILSVFAQTMATRKR